MIVSHAVSVRLTAQDSRLRTCLAQDRRLREMQGLDPHRALGPKP